MRGMGWRRDPPDFRDHKYALTKEGSATGALPPKKSLRVKFEGKGFDQGKLGSCVGNGLSSVVRFERERLGLGDFVPSRLFIYYFARRRMFLDAQGHETPGWAEIDSGAIPRDGMLNLVANGVCDEEDWPYDIEAFDERPPQMLLHKATAHKTTEYLRLPQELHRMKRCINEGHPFGFGFSVFSSLETDAVENTGVIPMPKAGDRYRGGHWMTAVGYDDATQTIEGPNSWGKDWGDDGFFHIPYAYLMDQELSSDLWTIRLTT